MKLTSSLEKLQDLKKTSRNTFISFSLNIVYCRLRNVINLAHLNEEITEKHSKYLESLNKNYLKQFKENLINNKSKKKKMEEVSTKANSPKIITIETSINEHSSLAKDNSNIPIKNLQE